jgi:hypothetical protein
MPGHVAWSSPTILGLTVGQWSARWWQWAFSIPKTKSPLLDETGAQCARGQKGLVWFLAGVWGGGTAERYCSVPAGKLIFFPIANVVWVQTAKDDPSLTEKDWRVCISFGNGVIDCSAIALAGLQLDLQHTTLDGIPIILNPKIPIVRTQSPVFKANWPADSDNLLGLDPNEYGLDESPSVSDGYWVMLPPLAPGRHVVKFLAGPPDKPAQNITYHIKVERGGHFPGYSDSLK